jgi:hypothetical protein
MSISSDVAVNVSNVSVNTTNSLKLDLDQTKEKSTKIVASASARKSVAALVNEKKSLVGQKLDISV